jgi:penicillin amidase
MKVKKIIAGVAVLLLLIILAGWILISTVKTRALPDYENDIQLTGITGKVEIIRDSFAIPHIYAENESDLYTAVGFVLAQDRLWQMDLLRRVTTGRLSEIFGPDMADADQLLRSLRMTQKSRKILAGASPELLLALNSFCSGVNQYIEKSGKKLPPEFTLIGYKPEPWLPENSINLIGYMAWDLSTGWGTEVLLHQLKSKVGSDLFADLLPDLLKQTSYVYPDFSIDPETEVILGGLNKVVSRIDELGLDVFRGSNNWAVSGEKSSTGKPLLANDMHLGLMIPGIWYQMHQVIPGKLNVTGLVLPGQPMVIAGHNDRIAWGFTNVMVDDVDFYEETINPANPDEYQFNGEWVKMEKTEELILTSKGDTIRRVNRFTHRGPVISSFKKENSKTISMHWLGNEESNELRTVYLLNRAANWDQFREALETFVSVNQNAVYADVDGNIGLQSTIGIPIRKEPGFQVYPGSTDEFDWKGLVPFNELPVVFNPPSGFVSSANNRTANPDYPYYISAWFDLPYRKDRIDEMLNSKQKLSADDFAAIQADRTSKMAQKFLPVFLALASVSDPNNPDVLASAKLLQDWNYAMDPGSPAAALFDSWYFHMAKNLAQDEMDSTFFGSFISDRTLVKNFMENILANQESGWCDNIKTPGSKETFADIVTLSLTQSVAWLSDKIGSSPSGWEWGKIHTFTIKHPMASVKLLDRIFGLSRGPFSVGGSFHTVGPYSYPFTDPSGVNHGASHRHIFNLGDLDASRTIIPTGTSGIPASRFYCDQTELYVNNKYHPDYITRPNVEKSARYRMVITGK